jgi:hypothetical protein
MAGLYWSIRRIGIEARWGDVHSGMAFERARLALLKLEKEPVHAKNWRPIILALGAASSGRRRILEFGQWLTAGRGVLSLGQVVSEGAEDRAERGEKFERIVRQTISDEGIEAFPAVVVDDELLDGLKSLLLCHGIGGVRPNTVLLGWSSNTAEPERFANILRLCERLRRNIVVVKSEVEAEDWEVPPGEIHIWWHGRRNGPLMLLLAHLLTQNDEFRRRKTRLIHVIPEESGREQDAAELLFPELNVFGKFHARWRAVRGQTMTTECRGVNPVPSSSVAITAVAGAARYTRHAHFLIWLNHLINLSGEDGRPAFEAPSECESRRTPNDKRQVCQERAGHAR